MVVDMARYADYLTLDSNHQKLTSTFCRNVIYQFVSSHGNSTLLLEAPSQEEAVNDDCRAYCPADRRK